MIIETYGHNLLQLLEPQIMDTQKNQAEKPTSSAAVATSCRKKKHEEASFLEDVKDHIDEFINASMDEHKTCFQKTIKKVCTLYQSYPVKFIYTTLFAICWYGVVLDQFQMFGLSKVVAEANSKATKEVESSLPLQTVLKE